MQMQRKFYLSILLAFFFNPVWAANTSTFGYLEGQEYKKIPHPQTIAPYSEKVVEVFYYGCPHCYHLEDSLNQWLTTKPKAVHFEQMPAVLNNPNWIFMARVFYTAKFLGIQKQFHKAYFDAIQRDKKRIFNIDALAKFAQPMGIKVEDYKSMFNSFQVSSAVSKAQKMTQNYGIDGVPAVIVNGKYLTDVPMASSRKQLWNVVDYLTNK